MPRSSPSAPQDLDIALPGGTGQPLWSVAQGSWRRPALAALVVLVHAAACDGGGTGASLPEENAPAARVVSLHPRASRFALALGVGGRLVAVDAASAELPGLETLPVTRLADASDWSPDLVLVGSLAASDPGAVARLRAAGRDVDEVAPRSIEEVLALCGDLGVRLAGAPAAYDFADRLGRELAALAGESPARERPRVAAVRAPAPLALAPAHGFETDLIELAGGTSTSHRHDPDAAPDLADLPASADLVLVVSGAPLSSEGRERARRELGDALPLAFFDFDRDGFWLHDAPDVVRRLRALLAAARAGPTGERPGQSP